MCNLAEVILDGLIKTSAVCLTKLLKTLWKARHIHKYLFEIKETTVKILNTNPYINYNWIVLPCFDFNQE